jgi:hypothetical protein
MRGWAALLLFAMPAAAGDERGSVADARGGEPLARVRVQLAGTEFAALTEPDGTFAIAGVPAGEYTLHVSTVGYRLLTKPFALADGETKDFEVALSPDTFRHSEFIDVRAGPFDLARDDSPSQFVLDGAEAKNLASVLADDPLRSVQSMPGVTSNDDFDARFSLRGAGYERMGVYLDGTLMHTPFHTLNQTTSGSLTVFNGDMLEDLELHPGAFPPRFEDRTGGVLDIRAREGSRSEPSFRATASFSNVGVMGEGPIGKRGSWIAGARKSYLQYLINRTSTDPSIAFGFTDAQGRKIELHIHEDLDGKRSFPLLAPVGADIKEPKQLFLVFMPGIDLVRRAGSRIDATIGDRAARPAGLPVLLGGHRVWFIRYADNPIIGVVNPPASRPLLFEAPGPGKFEVEGMTITVDGDRSVSRMIRLGGVEITGGAYRASRTGDAVAVSLDVTNRWKPSGLPLSMKILTGIVRKFRTWPTTYRWRGAVRDGEPPTMLCGWERVGRG